MRPGGPLHYPPRRQCCLRSVCPTLTEVAACAILAAGLLRVHQVGKMAPKAPGVECRPAFPATLRCQRTRRLLTDFGFPVDAFGSSPLAIPSAAVDLLAV